MLIFAIDNDNYITVFDSIKAAKRNPEIEPFSTLKELGKLAAAWPASRLIEIWNIKREDLAYTLRLLLIHHQRAALRATS
jgi:hypothetical protein